MAPRRKSAAQTAKLRELSEIHSGYMKDKAELRARIEAEYQSRLRDWELRESAAMNEARILGVPKTEIGRTVGLANWLVLEEKYALTADRFVSVEAETTFEINGIYNEVGRDILMGTVSVVSWNDEGTVIPMGCDLIYVVILNLNDHTEQIQWGTPHAEPFGSFFAEANSSGGTRGEFARAELEKIRQAIVSLRANG